MNITPVRLSLAALFASGAILSGCASPAGTHAAGTTTAAADHASMATPAMCDQHRQMMKAPPAERRAMMEERMKTMRMTPDAMHKHMQAMDERCK